jgi:hypothetical protein
LQYTNDKKTRWIVTGRSLAKPMFMEVERKLSPNASANDHIIVRSGRTEQSTLSPYKLVTFTATLDLSIPKDLTGFTGGTTADIMEQIINLVSQVNNAAAANVANASNTGLVSILSGGDF